MLMKTLDVMTREPHTGTPEMRLYQALQLMERHGFRHLPVTEHGRLVGLLSDTQIKLAISRNFGTDTETVEDRATLLRTVGEVMVRRPFNVRPDTPVRDLVHACVKEKHSAVPVVNAEGNLVGLVTTVDLLALLLPYV
jgi:acetoin utilization protein AcuB